MMRHAPSSRTKVRRSVKCLAPIAHSARTNAVAGPANSIETILSARASWRLAGEGRVSTMGKYSAIVSCVSVPSVAQTYCACG